MEEGEGMYYVKR